METSRTLTKGSNEYRSTNQGRAPNPLLQRAVKTPLLLKKMMRLEGSTNSQNVEKALEDFQASLGDFSGALASIAEDFRRMVAEQFATQGESGGTPWAGLAPSTRRRKKSGGSILNDTGALLQSLVDPDAPGPQVTAVTQTRTAAGC